MTERRHSRRRGWALTLAAAVLFSELGAQAQVPPDFTMPQADTSPGPVVFSPPKEPIAELTGTATTSVIFKQPGQYVVRVRADNFGRLDTSPGNQCCWTNGYVKVTVAP